MWNMIKVKKNTPEWRQWDRSIVFIVNFEHILHLVPVFLLILSTQLPAGKFPKTNRVAECS